MFTPPPEGDGRPAESVFVHGDNTTAISTLAVGLALRRHGSFSWADCSVSAADPTDGFPAPFARGLSRRRGNGINASELTAPHWSADSIERVLVPENRMDSLRLMSYLALPSLLQELAATTDATDTDMALSQNSHYLYVFDAGANELQAFSVHPDGTLSLIQTVSGLQAGGDGLAAN